MDNDRQAHQPRQAGADPGQDPAPSLPASARLSLNRCNLPAVILGSLTYQRHPVPLEIDGIRAFHADLFAALAGLKDHAERAQRFQDYMTVHFCLDHLEEAGLDAGPRPDRGQRRRRQRANANYLRLVRGWSFDSDGREGAVLKAWTETRFGLQARHHRGPLHGRGSDAYLAYLREGCAGLYGTNALEAQLDLLYTYCQHELALAHPKETHLRLHRGINRIDEHEVLGRLPGGRYLVLLNNLNSFTLSRERADEFGDYILSVEVPLPKVFFYNRLLPGMLKGEDELVAIGGVYEVRIGTF
jgi:NAD+---dinitrogen-reductase ADP-D-ribosyltransferase